jgi:hypothetical protein
MSVNDKVALLRSEMAKTLEVLEKTESLYQAISPMLDDKSDLRNAITLSEIFVNYYTCVETLFFRISSFFENHLDKERWHAELLKKMTLSIEGVRENVISDETFELLDEFRRFRHFKRYYFDFSYDWDRLELLQRKFSRLPLSLKSDLSDFDNFLIELMRS